MVKEKIRTTIANNNQSEQQSWYKCQQTPMFLIPCGEFTGKAVVNLKW